MSSDQPEPELVTDPRPPQRRPWVSPRVERMRAGDAENGIDNIVEDGMTTYGDS